MEAKLIYVVEDDEYIREAIVDLLESEGYQVMTAGNGQIAIDFLRATDQLPSLILLDLMMPVKDGFQFREEQLSEARCSGIPVVIMSADGNVIEKSRRTGASAYLKKPVDINDVLETVKRVISQLPG